MIWHTRSSLSASEGNDERSRWAVLLGEDDQLHAQVLTRLIEEGGQFRVVACAPDGDQAVELATTVRPDVVVLDIRMPLLDGIAATRAIHEVEPTLPIVLVSGYDYEERAAEAAEAGAADYIRKGRVQDDLLSVLLACVTNAQSE
jgi:CheY-like chemotaxis protein